MVGRILRWSSGAAIALVGGCVAFRALASDETQIRWMIEDIVEGFNSAELRPVMHGLSPEFIDCTTGVRRADLREALIYTFFQDVDPSTKEFLYRAELDTDALAIELREDQVSADVDAHVTFFVKRLGREELFWDARIQGEVREFDGAWEWTATTNVNHSERRRVR